MGIYSKQYQKILASEILRYLLLGSLPNVNDISQRIGAALGNRNNITYKYIPQSFKSIFQNELYNKAMRQIKFDIDLFEEELISLFSEASSRLNYADLFHKINSQELNKLKAQLELLLFTVKDADFYFDGALDTFSDSSKTNTLLSTKDIIDLNEECLALPLGGTNTKRIDVGSLVNQISTQILVAPPGSSYVISSNQIPSTKFGDIFTDSLSSWGQEIITDTNGPLEILFTFTLRQVDNLSSEFFVSRFEVTPYSPKKQKITISTSNDDVNYIGLLGYESGVDLEDQKKVYGFDFETTLVEYVKIKLSKQEADEEIIEGEDKKYKYIFGLKRFASFQTGRIVKGTYVSKPFSFNSEDPIGKVSIDVDQQIPVGCNTQFYIAGIDSNNKQSSFIPISPVGTSNNLSSSSIVLFNSVNKNTINFNTPVDGNDAPQLYGTAFQGKNFYRVGPALSTNVIFGNSKLYRGFNNWYRDYSGSFEILNVINNYVSFEHTDLEAIYTTITEVPSITSLGIDENGIKKIRLQVEKEPYYDSSRGHALKPQPGTQNSNLDTRPNYAIYKVIHRASSSRQTSSFSIGSSRTVYLPSSNFILQSSISSELPSLKLLTGQILTNGVDFSYELTDSGGRSVPTGRINILNSGSLVDGSGNVINTLLEFTYTVDPDITHKVSRIEGNNIILEHASNSPLDSIEITYRYIPKNRSGASSQIIKSSIRVSNLPTTSGSRTFYVEGRDYVIDPSTGGIQRIPTGTISTKGSVYVSFSYRETSSSVQTFTTWAFVSSNGGVQIKFDLDPTTKKNKLVVDDKEGESFYVNSKDGLINLTKSTSTALLPYGWVQFIVKSKNPSTNGEYGSNLIDQVIQLKDINKKKIFKAFNIYFNEITAFREPLIEKSLNHLKVNTLLSDHGSFAIDNTTDPFNSYIVLNFKPNDTLELYQKIPTEDSDEGNPPAVSNEEFKFNWSEQVETDSKTNSIVVKIELNRVQSADGALTPKVFSYQLRVGS